MITDDRRTEPKERENSGMKTRGQHARAIATVAVSTYIYIFKPLTIGANKAVLFSLPIPAVIQQAQ